MAWRKMRLGTALSLGGIVAAGPLIAACGGPSYEDWAATDGAAGRINLDDVQEAFKNSESATEFEKRVNEIYEGDGVVLIRASQGEGTLTLEGWEDLDNDNVINEANDDQLFSIVRGADNEYDMRGHHANGYYNSHFGAGDFLFTYLIISSLSGPRYYYSTPPSRGTDIRNQRTTYRNSSAYGGQTSAQRELQLQAGLLRRVALPVKPEVTSAATAAPTSQPRGPADLSAPAALYLPQPAQFARHPRAVSAAGLAVAAPFACA